MFNLSLRSLSSVVFVLAFSIGSPLAMAQVQKINLSNGTINAEITPDIGGRLLSFSLKDQPNFLLVGDLGALDTRAQPSPTSQHISYMGHEVWLGPQSEWWVHQNLNAERAAKKAVWPPDPYLAIAKNTVLEQSAEKVLLKSAESSISGVQLVKAYAFIPDRKNSLKLQVRATNIRKEDIAWDLWFNTRVPSNTSVYVPVANASDIRQQVMTSDAVDPLTYSLNDGIFALDFLPPAHAKVMRKGKLMIQPSQGWIASFSGKQLFIIQFPLQPQSAIHPEHGQVELYNEYNPANLEAGIMELEVHAPYKKLAPKEFMIAEETWTILEYKGAATRNAQLEFLRAHAAELGLR